MALGLTALLGLVASSVLRSFAFRYALVIACAALSALAATYIPKTVPTSFSSKELLSKRWPRLPVAYELTSSLSRLTHVKASLRLN